MARIPIRGGGKNKAGNVSRIWIVPGMVGNTGCWLILRAPRSQGGILPLGAHRSDLLFEKITMASLFRIN